MTFTPTSEGWMPTDDGRIDFALHHLQADGALDRAMLVETLRAARAEIADLKQSVISFCGPWAGEWAERYELPKGHLHPTHYDLLERCGARMVDFTRAAIAMPLPPVPETE